VHGELPPPLTSTRGLGIVDFLVRPHADSRVERAHGGGVRRSPSADPAPRWPSVDRRRRLVPNRAFV